MKTVVYCFNLDGEHVPMNSLEVGDEFYYITEGPILRFLWRFLPKLASWLVARKTHIRATATGITGRDGNGDFEIAADAAL